MGVRGKRFQGGWAAIDAMMGIVLFLLILPGVVQYMNTASEQNLARLAASQMDRVSDAAARYIKANYAALQAAATPTVAAVVNWATLQGSGMLPANLNNVNAYQQSYTLYVLEPTPGDLTGVVLTSGGRTYVAGNSASEAWANQLVPYAASLIGGRGGYTPTGVLATQTPTRLVGARGGWSLDLAPTTIPAPGAGHLASLVAFVDSELVTDYLARVTVPGQPELNRMRTTLDMTGNDIINGGTISAASVVDTVKGRTLSQAVQDVTIAAHGEFVLKPVCPGGQNPAPYVTPVMYSNDANGDAIGAVQAWAVDAGALWQVQFRILTPSGWVNPSAAYGRVLVIAKCN